MQQNAVDEWMNGRYPRKVYIFKDIMSGKRADRKGYAEMLDHARRRKIDIVVVYAIDRLSRSAKDFLQTYMSLDYLGIDIVSITQSFLSTEGNPLKRTMMVMFAEIAELERKIIVGRINDGLRAARVRGVKLGGPIKLTPEKIAQIKSLRAGGYTLRQITRSVSLSLGTVCKALNETSQTG